MRSTDLSTEKKQGSLDNLVSVVNVANSLNVLACALAPDCILIPTGSSPCAECNFNSDRAVSGLVNGAVQVSLGEFESSMNILPSNRPDHRDILTRIANSETTATGSTGQTPTC